MSADQTQPHAAVQATLTKQPHAAVHATPQIATGKTLHHHQNKHPFYTCTATTATRVFLFA